MARSFALPSVLAFAAAVGQVAPAAALTLKSPTVADGATLPAAAVYNGLGCTGANLSPALGWSETPAGTRSFAVTLFDPDAPTGSGWWHWVVYDIPASVSSLPAGAGSGSGLPPGARQARNDFGTEAYGGACPPPGPAHRYVFTLYALKVAHLDLPPDAGAAAAGLAIRRNALAEARITATCGR